MRGESRAVGKSLRESILSLQCFSLQRVDPALVENWPPSVVSNTHTPPVKRTVIVSGTVVLSFCVPTDSPDNFKVL